MNRNSGVENKTQRDGTGAPIRSHKDLIVWQKAMELAVMVYKFTKTFPTSERYALVAQIRRCAASVPANIAEGRGRYTTRDFANFVSIARGSAMETETLLLLAMRLNYLRSEQIKPALNLVQEIGKMLTALAQKLKDSGPEA